MPHNYILAPLAKSDLHSIRQYIAQDNPHAAKKVVEEIFRSIQNLAENPHIGHIREDLTDKPVRFLRVLRGIVYGTVLILAIYALLPLNIRFSRAIILIGTGWAVLVTFLARKILASVSKENFSFAVSKSKKRLLFVGSIKEIDNAVETIKRNYIVPEFIGIVTNTGESTNDERIIGGYDKLDEVVEINNIDEVIFCANDLTSTFIIKSMLRLTGRDIEFKIASPSGISLIGSSSVDTSGELYTLDFNSLTNSVNRRNKRVLDFIMAVLFLIFAPFYILAYRKIGCYFQNLYKLFMGKISMVGYYNHNQPSDALPHTKPGIISPADGRERKPTSPEAIEKLNLAYARDYKIGRDLMLIFKNIHKFTQNI